MSRSLEDRYRRLLAWYPQAHRDVYEEEMVGVLLNGARPGQRRPGFAESVNILGSAVRARIGSESLGLADGRWRVAAGVVGVLLPLLLALKNLRPLVASLIAQVRTGEHWTTASTTTWILAAVWTATAGLALVGWRRTACVVAWAALVTEVGLFAAIYQRQPVDVLYSAWTVVVGLTAAVCLTVAGPSERRFLRSRAGRAFGLAALLALATSVATPLLSTVIEFGPNDRILEPYLPMNSSSELIYRLGLNGLPAQFLAILTCVITAIGVLRLDPPTRRRLLAMLAPPAALIVVIDRTYAGYVVSSPRFNPPVLMVTGQWIGLVAVPLIAFIVAVTLVHRRERTVELVALGRQARRSAAAPNEGAQ